MHDTYIKNEDRSSWNLRQSFGCLFFTICCNVPVAQKSISLFLFKYLIHDIRDINKFVAPYV
jgi:hypothetical protein